MTWYDILATLKPIRKEDIGKNKTSYIIAQIHLKDQAEQELIDAKDILSISEYFDLMSGFKKLAQNPNEISEWYIFITYQSIINNFVSGSK